MKKHLIILYSIILLSNAAVCFYMLYTLYPMIFPGWNEKVLPHNVNLRLLLLTDSSDQVNYQSADLLKRLLDWWKMPYDEFDLATGSLSRSMLVDSEGNLLYSAIVIAQHYMVSQRFTDAIEDDLIWFVRDKGGGLICFDPFVYDVRKDTPWYSNVRASKLAEVFDFKVGAEGYVDLESFDVATTDHYITALKTYTPQGTNSSTSWSKTVYDEEHTFQDGTLLYDLKKYPVSDIISVTGILNGQEHTFVKYVDYRQNKNQIEWLTGGDNPDNGTVFKVTYTRTPCTNIQSYGSRADTVKLIESGGQAIVLASKYGLGNVVFFAAHPLYWYDRYWNYNTYIDVIWRSIVWVNPDHIFVWLAVPPMIFGRWDDVGAGWHDQDPYIWLGLAEKYKIPTLYAIFCTEFDTDDEKQAALKRYSKYAEFGIHGNIYGPWGWTDGGVVGGDIVKILNDTWDWWQKNLPGIPMASIQFAHYHQVDYDALLWGYEKGVCAFGQPRGTFIGGDGDGLNASQKWIRTFDNYYAYLDPLPTHIGPLTSGVPEADRKVYNIWADHVDHGPTDRKALTHHLFSLAPLSHYIGHPFNYKNFADVEAIYSFLDSYVDELPIKVQRRMPSYVAEYMVSWHDTAVYSAVYAPQRREVKVTLKYGPPSGNLEHHGAEVAFYINLPDGYQVGEVEGGAYIQELKAPTYLVYVPPLQPEAGENEKIYTVTIQYSALPPKSYVKYVDCYVTKVEASPNRMVIGLRHVGNHNNITYSVEAKLGFKPVKATFNGVPVNYTYDEETGLFTAELKVNDGELIIEGASAT